MRCHETQYISIGPAYAGNGRGVTHRVLDYERTANGHTYNRTRSQHPFHYPIRISARMWSAKQGFRMRIRKGSMARMNTHPRGTLDEIVNFTTQRLFFLMLVLLSFRANWAHSKSVFWGPLSQKVLHCGVKSVIYPPTCCKAHWCSLCWYRHTAGSGFNSSPSLVVI